MKKEDYAFYYLADYDTKPTVDWFAIATIEGDRTFRKDAWKVVIRIDDVEGFRLSNQYHNLYKLAKRYTIIDPFTIYKDGQPFFKVTDPEHIAAITEIMIKQ